MLKIGALTTEKQSTHSNLTNKSISFSEVHCNSRLRIEEAETDRTLKIS